ncbi:ubiquitin carboxyl-terminal hydrolase 47-like isoform X2 [Dermacentor albipictus]|uniref:ubiquitin carboxyl-terminal hydrolase 47-like isoform X2 n=1 Tax=Dermacentor albipictus TaxID=60249 RepID=UPI0038FC1104
MTPGENTQPVSDEVFLPAPKRINIAGCRVPAQPEPQAICIIRDMTTAMAPSSKVHVQGTGGNRTKVTLTLPATTTAAELMEAVGRHFQYALDSFELLFQRLADGDCVPVHTCDDKTLQELGFHTDGTSRNVLVMSDRNREPPKRLVGPEPDECSSSSSAAADWVRNTRGGAGESKYYPADTREAMGYVGLVNQAMTCYLNSLLQTLYMTPEFRNALYRWEFDGTEQDAAKSIPFQLQKLFLLLQTSSKPAIGTTDLTTSFGWDSSEAWQQHDVQELCRVMFDALEHKFKHTDQAKLICQLYEGKLKDYVKCLQCGYESAREDTFLDIPLVVRPFGSSQAYGSVEEALRAFVTPETLDGCNQYSCERCSRKCDAHKGLKFVRFPYLLTLQLKRFDFDPTTMHRIKLNDKVTFPEILDLNQFVRSESEAESPSDDADTTDSGSALDDEAAVTSTSSGPSSSRQTNGPCEDIGSDDEGIDVGSGSGSNADAAANARNLKRPINTGPYVYELFSIMVHSGSANGGHYYAYIKSFTEGQWYCFNDAQVSRVTYDEIRKTYGGGQSRGGYYISSYASSTNAYMLMYRRVDKEQNAEPMTPDQFPEHVKVLLESMQEAEERERQQKELDRSMCKIKLFCLHPLKPTMQEMRLKVHKDASLAEATETAHQIMGLEGVVPLECCRLVMYDDCAESLECSLEEVAHQTMGQILGGVKSTYPFDLLLEIRKPHETFQPYKIGGTTVKVHVVNLEANEIGRPIVVRGLKTQTVDEFKAQVAQQLGLPSSNMRMVLENYHNSLELLASSGRMLKSEGFGKSNTVYIEFLNEEDASRPFRESRFFEIIDRQVNTVVINVQLPPEEKVLLEKQHMSSSSECDQRCSNVEDEGGTGATKSTQQTQTSNTALSDGYDSDLCDSSSSGCHGAGGDHSEDSSLTDSERTLVGDDISPRNNSPDLAADDNGCCSGDERLPKFVPSVEMTDQIKRSMLEPSGSTSAAAPTAAAAPIGDGAGVSEEASAFACGDTAQSQVEAAATKEEPRRYFRAWPYTDREDNGRGLRVYVDKRITFGALKKELEPYVGIDSSQFKVFRVYSNNQEFECTKLSDNLASYAEDTKLVIKLGRALKSGEHRMEVYLLSPNAPEPSKFLLDWIFTQGTTVLQIKQEILHKIRERCGRDIPLNRCRLRKKISGNPGSVYLDSDRIDSDASMFLSHKVFLEVLQGPEKVVSANSLVLFVRRWRPSTFTFDPLEEVVLNERTVGALKDALSELSGLDPSVIEIAKCPGQFPCPVSSLTVHTEVEWHCSAPSLISWPLYIGEDGLVVLYRDRTETLKELTEEEKQEISSRENVRAPKGVKAVPSPRKERALKIYMGSPPNDSSALSSDIKPSLHSVPIDLD